MPAQPADKVIVTNMARLKQKYAAAGLKKVKTALRNLMDADAARGLKTVVVDLSSSADMGKHHGSAVSSAQAAQPKSNKQAIDKVYTSLQPAYLMILGAPDVVPHQPLVNPLFDPDDDDDQVVPSDLPYACSAKFGTSIKTFLAPNRVVGRLPDLTGKHDVAYLLTLLETAAEYRSRPTDDYDGHLGISAAVWKKSTQKSLKAMFGSSQGVRLAPADGPNWTADQFATRVHFVNCHGAPADPRYYGEKDDRFPIAHQADLLTGKITEGAIVAAECCYGAELYDPKLDSQQRMGICNAYLAQKAYAVWGSSTIAYGPEDENDQADLMCQYFVNHVRAGASTGRACLQARLEYVAQATAMTATDLKTVAQFNLIADPAVTPVLSTGPAPHALSGAKASAKGASMVERVGRAARRETLRNMALAAIASAFLPVAPLAALHTAKALKSLITLAADAGFKHPRIVSFSLAGPSLKKAPGAKAVGNSVPVAAHTILEREEADRGIVLVHGLDVVELDGVVQTRPFVSR